MLIAFVGQEFPTDTAEPFATCFTGAQKMRSSYMGDMGNMGDVGNVGGAFTGHFFPDRVGLPFVTTPDTAPGGPPQPNTIGNLPLIPVPRFPARNWAPEWATWLALGEFAATSWATLDPSGQPGWPNWVPKPSAVPTAGLNWSTLTPAGEVQKLVIAAANERADAMGEILAQSDEFISWFLSALTARASAYPKTMLVLTIAYQVATLPVMRLKHLYARPRPSELCPALLPPVAVPGHASFPSGHSTQAHLMALAMQDVLQGAPQASTGFDVLWTLADRIARNREIAGLHYASDSDAGVALAHAILPLLQAPLPGGAQSTYQAAILAARAEWQ